MPANTTTEDSMQRTTAGQAVNDSRTALGRAAVQTGNDRAWRIAAARAIVDSEGITLEDALARVWASVAFQVTA